MNDNLFKRFSIGLLMAWLLFLAFLPFFLVLVGSFLTSGAHAFFVWRLTIQNYLDAFQLTYFYVFLRSFYLAGMTALICLCLGYPFAYILSKLSSPAKAFLIFLMIIPFWTSSLIRIYSIIVIIRGQSLLSRWLMYWGVIHHPLQILYTQTAVLIGLVYALLPFMILPIYANLEKFDWRLMMAARDLGASNMRIFRKIIIPITMPGIVAGLMLVLLPAMTMFYIPDVLGGARSLLLGNLIKNQFIEAYNWPLGAAVSVVLTLIMGLLLLLYWKVSTTKDGRDLV